MTWNSLHIKRIRLVIYFLFYSQCPQWYCVAWSSVAYFLCACELRNAERYIKEPHDCAGCRSLSEYEHTGCNLFWFNPTLLSDTVARPRGPKPFVTEDLFLVPLTKNTEDHLPNSRNRHNTPKKGEENLEINKSRGLWWVFNTSTCACHYEYCASRVPYSNHKLCKVLSNNPIIFSGKPSVLFCPSASERQRMVVPTWWQKITRWRQVLWHTVNHRRTTFALNRRERRLWPFNTKHFLKVPYDDKFTLPMIWKYVFLSRHRTP